MTLRIRWSAPGTIALHDSGLSRDWNMSETLNNLEMCNFLKKFIDGRCLIYFRTALVYWFKQDSYI